LIGGRSRARADAGSGGHVEHCSTRAVAHRESRDEGEEKREVNEGF